MPPNRHWGAGSPLRPGRHLQLGAQPDLLREHPLLGGPYVCQGALLWMRAACCWQKRWWRWNSQLLSVAAFALLREAAAVRAFLPSAAEGQPLLQLLPALVYLLL